MIVLAMDATLTGLPSKFASLLVSYHAHITEAIRKNSHHDHRRALLMDFLRKSFGIEVEEVELEKKIKAAEARGRIDAFYKYVIFEIKTDLESERPDAVRELKKYFESRKTPSDYIAAVTDGLHFEIYDYDPQTKEPAEVRRFEVDPNDPENVYLELDELVASGAKIPPTSDDIVGRFGLKSTTFLRSNQQLEQSFTAVEQDSAVAVKFREWNALLSKVYGSAVGDKSLFLKHTYLTMLSRAIVTMALFPKHTRGNSLYRDLLTGKFFRDQSISNLAEPDFFSWALDTVAEPPFFQIFDALFKRLDEFDWNKLEEDLLKMLYQELVDPADRSGLGEFYTPDWLAELVLEDINFDSGSLLDPACGSGTFLFTAIRRLRKKGLSGNTLVKHVMESIIGLDVHPVAVLMAKANVLLALAPELKPKRDFDFSIRCYLSDTLQTQEKKGKNYLGIPDGMGREFAIPLRSLELNRDLDQIIDNMATFAHRAASSEGMHEPARKGFLAKLKDLEVEEVNLWRINFDLMVKLMKSRRDSVWAFILKNAFRPAYLRRTKVDVVVGNPPWLSFHDIAEEEYKNRIKELTFGYGLLEKTERKLFTQMDTSTLFYVHCRAEFLKPNGKIAFVLPKTAILPAKQHFGFQQVGFSRLHDFSQVTVNTVHFFNVRTCVVVEDGALHHGEVPMKVWRGELHRKNIPLKQARHLLSCEETLHEFLATTGGSSPYFARALQGATLNPHTLWFVGVDNSVPLNLSRPMMKTSEDSYRLCKEEKWKLRVKGAVEREFLFATVLSDDILPFFVRGLTLAVLPVMVHENRYVMMNHSEILAEGYEAASEWVKRAERIFHKGSKNKKITAQEYLNYQGKLTSQLPTAPYIVLYNKSGTNLCAGYLAKGRVDQLGELSISGCVAESVTYRIYTDTENEALYLIGVLNSNVVNDAIKPYQTEGLQGKRDIHRRPFEVCPIPEYDKTNPVHMGIVHHAKAAKVTLEKWGPKMEGGLAKVREKSRELIAEQLREIDDLVASMFKGTKLKESKTGKKKKDSLQSSMF